MGSTFNTARVSRALEAAGMDRAEADYIAEAIRQRQDYATKADIAALETSMTNRMYALAAGLAALVTGFGIFG